MPTSKLQTFELLPPNTNVSDILIFLENILEDKAARKRSAQVLRSLLYAEHLQVSAKEVTMIGWEELFLLIQCGAIVMQSIFSRIHSIDTP